MQDEAVVDPGLDHRVATLFEEESPKMWRSLLLNTGDPEVANDAVAEAFAQLIGRGDAVRDPRAWVWRAALRIGDGMGAARRPLQGDPLEAYELEEPVVDLVRALRQLSPMQRGAIVLHHLADMSVAETAAALGSTRSAVTVHLHRGRKRLREILEDVHE